MDPASLLGELARDAPPDKDPVVSFDRDWWLFRYIIMFLRDGFLPDDRTLLAQVQNAAAAQAL